ncbi:MAG: AlpA family phage regulatory protein [Polaromonas sp.]
MDQSRHSSDQLLRLPEVLKRYPMSRTSWYDGIQQGLYPAPLRLGKRTVAWRVYDIEQAIRALNASSPLKIKRA